jgi:uncharacterized protein YbaR (Trm112 family)
MNGAAPLPLAPLFHQSAAILACPHSGAPLDPGPEAFAAGDRRYPVEDGIPRLYAPLDPALAERDVTELVKAFYEETRFPTMPTTRPPSGLPPRRRKTCCSARSTSSFPTARSCSRPGAAPGS